MTTKFEHDQWGREVPPPAPRHQCPDWHAHGERLCLDRHQCACSVCEEARDTRTLERRRKDLQRPAERPVNVRWVKPTRSAPTVPQKRPDVLQTFKPDETPKKLPAGVEHGTTAYSSYACRCDVCRAAHSSYQKAYREAKAAGTLPTRRSSEPDYRVPVQLKPGQTHGTATSYGSAKCRCEECVRWKADKRRRGIEARKAREAGGDA